jgi:hypothetical protein
MTLTVEELLLGAEATHTVEIPADVLRPAGADEDGEQPPASVVIRPLKLADVQRIQRAARDEKALTSVLMVKEALVEPKVTVEQVNRMHAGLVEFLLREVNRVSGLSLGGDELQESVQAPLARACFVLAREFGWTPEQCAALTLGQVLVYLELLGRGEGSWSAPG